MWILSLSLLLMVHFSEAMINVTASTVACGQPTSTLNNVISTFWVRVNGRGPRFSPPRLDAAQGSLVRFDLFNLNYTIFRSNVSPCLNNNSRALLESLGPQLHNNIFTIDYFVRNQEPQWFYHKSCADLSMLCEFGNVFFLNVRDKFASNVSAVTVPSITQLLASTSASAVTIPPITQPLVYGSSLSTAAMTWPKPFLNGSITQTVPLTPGSTASLASQGASMSLTISPLATQSSDSIKISATLPVLYLVFLLISMPFL